MWQNNGVKSFTSYPSTMFFLFSLELEFQI